MFIYHVFVNRPAGQLCRIYSTMKAAKRYSRWVMSRFGLCRTVIRDGWIPPKWYHNAQPSNPEHYTDRRYGWVDVYRRPTTTFLPNRPGPQRPR